MNKLAYASLLSLLLGLLTGCGGDDNDDSADTTSEPPPSERTYVVFGPATGDLPVPNDLLFSREEAGDGTMFAGDEPDNPVISGIDALDGNSVLAPIDISFSDSLDPNQTFDGRSFVAQNGQVVPNPAQNVFLLPLTYPGGDPLSQASVDIDNDGEAESVEIPTFSEALNYQRAAASGDVSALMAMASPSVRTSLISLDGGTNNVLRIQPIEPLMPKTKYLVVLTGPVTDMQGNEIYPSIAYETIKDPVSELDSFGLNALRSAIQGWEQLANGYFGFKQTVFSSAGVSAGVPTDEDILFTLSFTTTATDDVLKKMAAPEVFFEENLRRGYRQDAIEKLVNGSYNLSGDTGGMTSITDRAINRALNFLLTSPQLPDTSPNPLYNAGLAAAIEAGAGYSDLASSASSAYLLQLAAAEAAIQVHDSGSQDQGDQQPYVSISAEAMGTVQALAAGAEAPVNMLFPTPSPRESQFFRVDPAASINPALTAPAMVYQGEITLPYFAQFPDETSGDPLLDGFWSANTTIGAVIDAGQGNPAGTTPPSSMITYRYPFPTQTGEQTVPLMAVMPDETTLGSLGITRPENGWPVVIYTHGITTDRSITLPIANGLAFACVDTSGEVPAPSGAPCFATVAIDQPLHGIAAEGSVFPGLSSFSDPNFAVEPNHPAGDPNMPSVDLAERHFNYTANAELRPMPMDYDAEVGSSGSLFVNLSNFPNVRDNLRQMVQDLLNLNATLATMDVDGDGLANDLDTSRVYFLGHSLGGVNGLPFVAINNLPAVQNSPFSALPKIQAASSMFPGGGIPRLLTNSPNRGPAILQGLANASEELQFGRSGLETYLGVYQGVLDSIDPNGFAPLLSEENSDTGVLLFEVVGDGTSQNPPDQTIPNAADDMWGAEYGPFQTTLNNGFVVDNFPAPFAGTEPLAALFGAIATDSAEADGDQAVLITRFNDGSHNTPISAGNTEADPLTSGAVFMEMLTQLTMFYATNGVVPGSIVTNGEVIAD